MTREDAIELIKHMSMAFVPTDQYGDYIDPEPYEEAVDMAIEALSAKPGGDLIRRSDAIEAVCTEDCGITVERCEELTLGKHCKVYNALSALPPAETVQEWIPIGDGLPKLHETVMTTIYWVGDEYEDDYDIAVGFRNTYGHWDLTLADGTGVVKGFLVQAWMPLPTPYKGGDTE